MSQIFLGFLFTFLDFNFTVDSVTIGLLPDFIGFFLIAKGLKSLKDKSNYFEKALPLANGMIVLTMITYVFDLIGLSSSLGILSFILGLTLTIVGLYISYKIVQGILDLERLYQVDLNGQTLLGILKVLAVLEVLAYIAFFIPALAILLLICILVFTIIFLINFNTSRNRYEQLQDN